MQTHSYHANSASTFLFAALLVAVGLFVLYLVAVTRQAREGRYWGRWRTASFGMGTLLLWIALSPPLADLSHHNLSAHILQHLLIAMLAPLGLVLGAPLTLAFRTLPVRVSRFITVLLHRRPLRWLIHPVMVLLSNIGGMYLLYLTPLYALTLTNPYVHAFMHLHFLVAGYLFTWTIAGSDPAPGRPGMRARLVVLFLSIAAHAILAKLLYIYLWPEGTPHNAGEIRAAAQLMYYGGDFAEILLLLALFTEWFRSHRDHESSPARQPSFLFTETSSPPAGGSLPRLYIPSAYLPPKSLEP